MKTYTNVIPSTVFYDNDTNSTVIAPLVQPKTITETAQDQYFKDLKAKELQAEADKKVSTTYLFLWIGCAVAFGLSLTGALIVIFKNKKP